MDHSTKTVLYFTKSGNTTQQPEPGGPGTPVLSTSRLAQLVERKTLNLVVVGSSPTVGGPAPRARTFLLLRRGIGAIGSVRASQARGTGIETQILQ